MTRARLLTWALWGFAAGMLLGRYATRSIDALTVEAQALQLAQERQASCSMARALVRQHDLVRHVWPGAPRPEAIVRACDQDEQPRAVLARRIQK